MPEIVVQEPPTIRQLFMKILAIPLGTLFAVGIVVGIATDSIGIVIAAVIVPALMAFGFFGQAASVQRDENRIRASPLLTASPDTLFAANAVPVAVAGEFSPAWVRRQQRAPGVLSMDALGVAYSPKRVDEVPVYGAQWSDVTRVDFNAASPILGTLEIWTAQGYVYRWRVKSVTTMIDGLDKLRNLLAGPPRV